MCKKSFQETLFHYDLWLPTWYLQIHVCIYIDTLLLSYLFHAATTESWLNHLEVSNGASEQSTRSQSAWGTTQRQTSLDPGGFQEFHEIYTLHLEDHHMTCRCHVTMVIVSPLTGGTLEKNPWIRNKLLPGRGDFSNTRRVVISCKFPAINWLEFQSFCNLYQPYQPTHLFWKKMCKTLEKNDRTPHSNRFHS